MNCPKCYHECDDTFNYCPGCGAPLMPATTPRSSSWTKTRQEVAALSPPPARTADLSAPLIGRTEAMGLLRARVRELVAGRGGAINLIGEAGIGKSRLIAELRADGEIANLSPSPMWLEGGSLSFGESPPYWSWLAMIRAWAGSEEGEDKADTRRKLYAMLDPLFAGEVEIYPFLASLLSLELTPDEAAHLVQLDEEGRKTQTWLAIRAWLDRLAHSRPLIAVFEDLQWADAASLSLLMNALPLTESAPLLFINLFRPERDSPCWELRRESEATLSPSGHYTEIVLGPLSPRESDQLITHLLGQATLPTGLTARIGARAEGNPLFTEEIVRALVESGDLVHDATHRVWLTTVPVDQLPIPTTLHEVINERIDHLDDDARRTLQQAAVVGRVFWDSVVSHVADGSGDPSVTAQLEHLVQAGLIIRRGRAAVLGNEYAFKHAITHQAAYDSIPQDLRRTFHQRVVAFIESRFADRLEEYLALLAHHAHQAADSAKATHYARLAAESAARRFANQEAIRFYQQALEGVTAPNTGSRALRFDLLHGLNVVYARVGDVKAQERTLKEMVRLASLLADANRLVDVYVSQAALYVGSNLEQAEEAARSALRLARVMGNHAGEARALLQYAWVDRRLWRKREAVSKGEAALAACRQAGNRQLEGRALGDLADFNAFAYQFETALKHSLAALDISQAINDPSLEAEARLTMSRNLHALRRHDEAIEQAQAAVALARRIGHRQHEATALNALGTALSEAGQHDTAIETYRHALEIYREIGDRIYESWLNGNIGWIQIRRGDFTAALDAFQKSRAVAARIENRSIEARALMAMASLHRQIGRYVEAQQLAQTARAIVPRSARHEIERWALGELSLAAWWQGEFSLAMGLAQTALGLAWSQQDQQAIGWDTALLAAVHLGWPWFDEQHGQGSLELALKLASQAEEIGRQTHDRFVQIWGAEVLSLAHWRLGQLEPALTWSRRTIELLDDTPGYPAGREPFYLEHGLILQACGLDDEAEVFFQRAREEMNAKASRFTDPALRRAYLENIPVNRAIRGTG